MKNEVKQIRRMFLTIDNSLFMTTGKLDYDRITEAITRLAELVKNDEGENESIWSIGEYRSCALPSLFVGAYWHYTEWHEGQYSDGYKALSALGRVFTPGMTSIESERGTGAYTAYEALEARAQVKEGSFQ